MKINIKNFRNIVDASIKINKGKINYILGSNEAGKTNVLTSIRFLDRKSSLVIETNDYTKKSGKAIKEAPSVIVDNENGAINIINKNNSVSYINIESNNRNGYFDAIEKENFEEAKKLINELIVSKTSIGDSESQLKINELNEILEILEEVKSKKRISDEKWKKIVQEEVTNKIGLRLRDKYEEMKVDYPEVNYVEPILRAKEMEEISYPVHELFETNSMIRNIFNAFTSKESIESIKELEEIEDEIEREGAEEDIFSELNENIANYFKNFKHIQATPYFKISGGKIILLIQSKNKWIYDSKNENERSLGFKTFSRIIIELKAIKETHIDGSDEFYYIVDEPEQSLHPFLQGELLDEMKRIVGDNITIILATHSPYIVHIENIEEILDCQYITRGQDGSVSIENFSSKENILKKAKNYFTDDVNLEHHYFYKVIFDSYGNHHIYNMIQKRIKLLQKEINSNKNIEDNKAKIEELILFKNFINKKD